MFKTINQALKEDGYTSRAKEAYSKMFKDGDNSYYKIAENLYDYMHETFPTTLNPIMLRKFLDILKNLANQDKRKETIIENIIQIVLEEKKELYYKNEKIKIDAGEIFSLNYDGAIKQFFKKRLVNLCMFVMDNQYAYEKLKDNLIQDHVGSIVLFKNDNYLHKVLDLQPNQLLVTGLNYDTRLRYYYEIEEVFPFNTYEELHSYYNNQKKQFIIVDNKINQLKKRKQVILEKTILSNVKLVKTDFSHFLNERETTEEHLNVLLICSSSYELVELIKFCRNSINEKNKNYISKVIREAESELRRKLYV